MPNSRSALKVRAARVLTAAALSSAIVGVCAPNSASAYGIGFNDYPDQDAACNVTYSMIGACPSSQWDKFGSQGSVRGYAFRNCTDFVAFRENQLAGRMAVPPNWGNAANWGMAARMTGLRVDNVPSVGAVAQTASGPYGHVAIVAEVRGNAVRLEEYNQMVNGGFDGQYHADRWVSAGSYQYIHFF